MESPSVTQLYAILPHPSRPAVLAFTTPDGPALPHAQLSGSFSQARIDQVQAGLGSVCRLPFNVLCCLAFDEGLPETGAVALYLLEARPEALRFDLSEDAQWLALDSLDICALLPQSLCGGFANWRTESDVDEVKINDEASIDPATYTPGSPGMRPAWAMPGWYAQAEAWIGAALDKLGQPLLRVEPLKSWSISVVLRAQTDASPAYFKASRALPLFVNEGVVMTALAQLYPAHIPAPLAIDAARGWMLLPDLGQPLGRTATLEQQAQMFETMARIQINSAGQIEHLLRAGCLDRRIPWLNACLDALLADDIATSKITPDEREALRQSLPHLRELLAELDSLPIPPTLIHGDFHAGNVALRDGQILIFDWTDAAISHPFFDLFDIYFVQDPFQRETLLSTYRAIWEQAYPAAPIRRALELARVLFGLYHAVSYQSILNHIAASDREEINTAHYFLRLVLSGLD